MYIVVSLGCSGSTALYRFLSTLWKELGIEMNRGIDWEWMHQAKNKYIVHDKNLSLADSLLLIWQHTIKRNRSVLLKFDHEKNFAELRIALSNIINAKV